MCLLAAIFSLRKAPAPRVPRHRPGDRFENAFFMNGLLLLSSLNFGNLGQRWGSLSSGGIV